MRKLTLLAALAAAFALPPTITTAEAAAPPDHGVVADGAALAPSVDGLPDVDPSTVPDPEADVAKFVAAVAAAATGKHWAVLVALLFIGAIGAFRKWIVPLTPKLAWFKTTAGGALLMLLSSAAGAVYLAAQAGASNAGQFVMVAVGILVTNYSLFKILKNLLPGLFPDGAAEAAKIRAEADAALAARVAALEAKSAVAPPAASSLADIR